MKLHTLHAIPRSAVALLALCRDLDIRLEARGDRLRFSAPPGGMPEEVRAALVAYKAEVLALLAPGPEPAPIEPEPLPWSAVLASLRSQADADGVVRDDPDDLFNVLADAGCDRGLSREQWEATLEHHRVFTGKR